MLKKIGKGEGDGYRETWDRIQNTGKGKGDGDGEVDEG